MAKRTKLLSEIYYVTRDEPGVPNRLAANVGFKHKFLKDLTVHGSSAKASAKAIVAAPTSALMLASNGNSTHRGNSEAQL